ncbi:methionine--tRNA ligase, mitochondrial-like [Panonychus citri]|uniref:methionine--tRNA ligase, mitochondrial-like n=1 Tax=Panonychus citri TaxID=50023 RepID=UPI0023075274|nr:methionine--tRNA ligase, mitochondrial-like [Panonychus citri]
MRLISNLYSRIHPVSSNYFISTPIFYVNADPHIGHVHTLVVTDALHRLARLKGAEPTMFTTGTDEHGLKIQRAALARGFEPQQFCDNISKRFANLCSTFNIGNTHFIRTTDSSHLIAVQHFWNQLVNNGYIYKSKYSGWYSVSDETFLPSSSIEEKDIDGIKVKISTESGHVLEWFEEENYMFKLSQFSEPLINYYETEKISIKPNIFHQLVVHLIKQGLNDISISRPISRLSWGVPVPSDESQRIYVWLDALVNYLTVAGYPNLSQFWPPDCHVIGKDIIKFHGIYWPAFLLAAKLELPKRIICHSHWTVDGVKMSKSRQNIVDPFNLLQTYSQEWIRYFLLRQAVPHDDGNFSESQMCYFLNMDLADTFGNLLSRCCAPKINLKQIYPKTPDHKHLSQLQADNLIDSLIQLSSKVDSCFSEAHFYDGIDLIMSSLRMANKMVQDSKPWELAKDPEKHEQLYSVIYLAFEALRVVGILMQPVIPQMSTKLLDKLSIPTEERFWSYATPRLLPENSSPERPLNTELESILFNRIR